MSESEIAWYFKPPTPLLQSENPSSDRHGIKLPFGTMGFNIEHTSSADTACGRGLGLIRRSELLRLCCPLTGDTSLLCNGGDCTGSSTWRSPVPLRIKGLDGPLILGNVAGVKLFR